MMATRYTDIEVVQRLSEMLSDPKRWVKGTLFADENGRETDAYHARSYCLSGALIVASGALAEVDFSLDEEGEFAGWESALQQDYQDQRNRLSSAILKETPGFPDTRLGGLLPGVTVIRFNDNKETTHEMILDVLQKTVDKLTSDQS